jgi:hypothetical protein
LARRIDCTVPFIPFTAEEASVIADVILRQYAVECSMQKKQKLISISEVTLHIDDNVSEFVAKQYEKEQVNSIEGLIFFQGFSSIRKACDVKVIEKVCGIFMEGRLNPKSEAFVTLANGRVQVSTKKPETQEESKFWEKETSDDDSFSEEDFRPILK